jgi:hypothetical protein
MSRNLSPWEIEELLNWYEWYKKYQESLPDNHPDKE